MRVWDISPGYLNRQSLLGEHRELHGIVSIIANNKKGYANHPETLRWVGYGWALRQRHRLLAEEMSLRGYIDKSPVRLRSNKDEWPQTYIDEPYAQFQVLKTKYQGKEPGRIPLPNTPQDYWEQHKYSVMARGEEQHERYQTTFSGRLSEDEYAQMVIDITEVLRLPPKANDLRNTLLLMRDRIPVQVNQSPKPGIGSSRRLIGDIQRFATEHSDTQLMSSTALSELRAWLT